MSEFVEFFVIVCAFGECIFIITKYVVDCVELVMIYVYDVGDVFE